MSSSSNSTGNSLLRIAMPVASSLILAYYVFTLPMSFMGGSSSSSSSSSGEGKSDLQVQIPVQSKVEVFLPPLPAANLTKQTPKPKTAASGSDLGHSDVGSKKTTKKPDPVVAKKTTDDKPSLQQQQQQPAEEVVQKNVRTPNTDPVPILDGDEEAAAKQPGEQAEVEEEEEEDDAVVAVDGLGTGGVFHSLDVFKKNYQQMEKKFKVFIYPDGDPDTYYQTPRKLTGKYASEGYFFQNLRESKFVTRNPNKAHLFFLPISCHKMRGKGISYEKMADIVQEYVEGLIAKYPYWNRTLGADHFFVTCHDVGARATNNVAHLVKNSIRVVCSPSYNGDFIPHKDVALPQVLQPFALPRGGNDVKNRTILGFWAGHRNSKIRVVLAKLWEGDDVLAISNNRISRATGEQLVYQKQFYKSKFCICPGGSQVNSARIVDSIHYGCVPVILSDYYDLPFNDVLDWNKFALLLREGDVSELKAKLESMSRKQYLSLHKRLVEVQDRFEWHTPPRPYDAFHMVMYELWLRHFTVQYKK